MKNELKKALNNLNDSFKTLAKIWAEDDGECRILEGHYPFKVSFDELATDVNLWVEKAIESADKLFIWQDGSRRYEIEANYFTSKTDGNIATLTDHEYLQDLEIGDHFEPESEDDSEITRIK